MLTSFIDSKPKRRLLNVLFLFPQRSFHLNELKELLKSGSRSLSTILNELVREDVINQITKKRRRYYRINPYLSWYDELSQLVSGEKVTTIDLASKYAKNLKSAKVVVLTGLFTFQPQVEVDLLLVGAKMPAIQINRLLNNLEKLAGQEINYCTMDPQEYEYRQHMHDRFIRDILDNTHLVVVDKLTLRQKNKKTRKN